VLIVAFYTAWNGLRLWRDNLLLENAGQYGAHPLYVAISGAVWLIAGCCLSGVFGWESLGWAAALGGTVGYTTWYWYDRAGCAKPHANWPFVMIGNIIFLC